MIVGTKLEFESLAEYILRDYLGNEYESPMPIDIQAFATDYLKLEIAYCKFDENSNIAGMRTGSRIYLDERLMSDDKVGERNFTIAHECGHDLINWQDPSYAPHQSTNYRIPKQRKELKTEDDFREWQANVVAAYLLLRPYLVGWAMFTFMKKDKLVVYGEYCLCQQDRYRLAMMAKFLGVSRTCLLYRLEHLEMIDRRKYEEYDPSVDICLPWR